VNPYFQSFSCVLSYYQYPISTWSKSITSLIIKLMSNLYHLLSISIHVSLINYDVAQLIESSSPRSCGDSNWFGLAGVSLPHDVCKSRPGPMLAYINPHSDPPLWESDQRYPRASIPPLGIVQAWCIHKHGYIILSPSLHSQCAVVVSHKGLAKVLGLPEYVANTTSHDHRQLYNDRSLIDIGGVTTSRLKLGASQDSARSWFKKN
jgi:hypothetical protein